MKEESIDWNSLDFKCSREAERLPRPVREVDALFQEANALYKDGLKRENEAMLKNAAERFLKAAEKGHVKAMNNLVVMYLDGDGVKQSDSKAVHWAEELIKRNIGAGYYHMGVFLEQGIGVRQDREAALTYFRKAADLGNAQGQLASAVQIRKAVAQLSPEEQARGYAISRAMFQCSLGQGLADAGYELGRQYRGFEENMPEALKAFQAAAKLGHNQSLWALHVIFRDGATGIEKDEARAACYERLSDEVDADKTKKFPGLDSICPLPPRPMPGQWLIIINRQAFAMAPKLAQSNRKTYNEVFVHTARDEHGTLTEGRIKGYTYKYRERGGAQKEGFSAAGTPPLQEAYMDAQGKHRIGEAMVKLSSGIKGFWVEMQLGWGGARRGSLRRLPRIHRNSLPTANLSRTRGWSVDSNEGNFAWDFLACAVYLLEVLCVVSASLFFYNTIRPRTNWLGALNVAWWTTIVLGALATCWVAYLFASAVGAEGRIVAYYSALTFSPAIVAAGISLIFRPAR